jgi:formylglycine-generating enzyme required for sulfatase activity
MLRPVRTLLWGLALSCLAIIPGPRAVAAASGPQAAIAPPAGGYRETIPDTVIAFEMVPVPGGTVTIDGAVVTVEPFLIGRTEVTWEMYDAFAIGRDAKPREGVDAIARPSQPYGAPDYNWGHNGYPVISVTRDAAAAFCKWLSTRTGTTYRLPTEAEWLRAAGLATAGTTADRESVTWHSGNSKGTTHPVGKRSPDALGLFDLFGNAAEWIRPADGAPVTRGGSFRDSLEATGPAARAPYETSWQERDPQLPKSNWWLSDGPFVGFRLATSRRTRS